VSAIRRLSSRQPSRERSVSDAAGSSAFGQQSESLGRGHDPRGRDHALEPVGRPDELLGGPWLVHRDGSEQDPLAKAAGKEVTAGDHLGQGVGPGSESGVGQQSGGPAVQMAAHRAVRHRRVLIPQDSGHQVGLVRLGDIRQGLQVVGEAPVLGGLPISVEAGHAAIPSGR
jgi:hypothetical protein